MVEANVKGISKGVNLSAITNSDLFANFLPAEKEAVIRRSGYITLEQGEILFSPSTQAERLYVLCAGHIRIFKRHEDTTEEEIASFTPGSLIGELDFGQSSKYNAYAQALEDSTLAVFPGPGFNLDAIALGMPNLVSRLLLNSAAMLSHRITATRKMLLKNIHWVHHLFRKAYEDPGTGLLKQSFLTDEIEGILEVPTALILLKPDRFKVLVDTVGHETGDKAMVQIASILKNTVRRFGRGWAIRLRSNETGILINNCTAEEAASLADALFKAITAIPPIPMIPAEGARADTKAAPVDTAAVDTFTFSASIVWAVWPLDTDQWQPLFDASYDMLLQTWKDGGGKVTRYAKGGAA